MSKDEGLGLLYRNSVFNVPFSSRHTLMKNPAQVSRCLLLCLDVLRLHHYLLINVYANAYVNVYGYVESLLVRLCFSYKCELN